MKKTAILLVLALATMTAVAQNGRIALRHDTKAEITKSDFTKLTAVFSYGTIESQQVSTEKGTFSEIAIEGTYASGAIGTPELPASHQLLAVPFGATPRVTVVNYTTTDYQLSDYGIGTILPHQPSVRKDQKPEDVKFIYNPDAYQARSLNAQPEVTIEVQGTLRGIRVGSLVVNPVSYNPASNTIRVFNDIEVEITFDGADRAETERMLLNTYSPYFDIVYKQMFNYRDIMSVYDDHPDLMAYPVHMIVVTPQNYVSTLQPWINWKVQKGFNVSVYTTAQTGTSYSAIRNYVRNLYNTGVSQGQTPTFLILVGDTGQIPGTTGSQTQEVTDLYYGTVDNDYFPDMFYSRMSAENTTQLTAIVNKILQYEQYTMPDPSYLSKVTLIAGWDDYFNGYIGQPTINYATTYYYNTAHGFTTVNKHLNQSQYSGCYNALSTGIGFVNYTAHGSETSWAEPYFSSSNVNSLSNTNKYFLAMGNCCLSGDFGYYQPCLGEAMIRATNKGAFSYIGSCPETYWYEDYYFGVGATNTFGSTPTYNNSATGVYDAVWMDETYNTVSSMVFLGNIAVTYANANGYSGSTSPLYYWQAYHVLGDGSIMPYRVQPTANTVSHASSVSASASSFTVTAQAGSYVGISQNNELKGAALVPASGSVSVPVTGLTSGQAKVVVTKPQRQPHIQDITVTGGGTPTYTVSIVANPAAGGTVSFNSKGTETYDFEADYTAGEILNWTTIDADGDDNDWYVRPEGLETLGHNDSEGFVTSASYVHVGEEGGVALTPDNFLVSPQGQYTSISFWACAQDAAWPSEHFGVAVSTTNNTNASAFTTIQEWTMTAKSTGARKARGTNEVGAYHQYTVDLSAYAGQEIYVAIRHFDCTDWFRLNVDDIALTTGGGGSGPSNPITATYTQGQSCTVRAVANTGYNFTNWTENGTVVSTNANYTFTVTGNRTLMANFSEQPPQPQQYTVSIVANPAAGGTVSFNSKGTETYDFEADYTAGEILNWTTIDADGDDNDWYVRPEGLETLGHNDSEGFVTSASYVHVGEEGGVALTPDNFLVSPQGQYTSISFWACAQDAAWPSEHFGVAVSTTNNTNASAFTTIQEWTMTAKSTGARKTRGTNEAGAYHQYTVDLSAYAGQNIYVAIRHFDCTDWFRLNVDDITLTTGGGGSGPSNPITATYTQGQSCTVRATANTGYNFTNWTENGTVVSTNANYTFTVNANRTLVANFTEQPQPQEYTINVSANPSAGGTVSGGGTVVEGQSCTVRATANTGYNFTNWTENGSVVSTNANYTFTVNANRTLVANFTEQPQPQEYTINVSANPSAGGTVSGGGTVVEGQSCTVRATANTGYNFTNWTENGSVVSTNANYTFTVNANRTLVANFTLKTFTVTASVDLPEGGTASVEGDNHYGATVSVTVHLNNEYAFLNWTENGQVVSEDQTYTFVLDRNRTLVAHLLSTVGLMEQGSDVKMYPNPVTDKLTIETVKAVDNVEIYNLMGVMVHSQKDCGEKVEIATGHLPAGTYLIRLTTDDAIVTRRFVKD